MPEEDRVCAAASHVRKQIDASAYPHLPLLWTEWNVPGRDRLRDTPYVGPALAEAIRTCRDVQALSFWTFSDVFEEGGPAQRSFDGQFGLRATGGINKPSFYDFALLHQLGTQRLANDADDIIVTKLANGSLAIALWNLAPTGQSPAPKSVTLDFTHLPANASITMQRVDDTHSNVLKPYAAMGSPAYPKPEQVEQLNRETALPAPEPLSLTRSTLTLTLDTNALVLLQISR
jgi:xylan 1,4-beta-xylosidase